MAIHTQVKASLHIDKFKLIVNYEILFMHIKRISEHLDRIQNHDLRGLSGERRVRRQ